MTMSYLPIHTPAKITNKTILAEIGVLSTGDFIHLQFVV
jgi:hypothetical protein